MGWSFLVVEWPLSGREVAMFSHGVAMFGRGVAMVGRGVSILVLE